jgi:DNA-binding protein YbaB
MEDLIMAAHNDAKTRVEAKIQSEMADLTGGLNLPPGFKLPF